MTLGTQAKVWGIALVVFVALLVLLKSILLPFVAGMAIAYLLDPVCDRLEAMGTSRTLATSIVTAIFAVVVILLLLLIAAGLTVAIRHWRDGALIAASVAPLVVTVAGFSLWAGALYDHYWYVSAMPAAILARVETLHGMTTSAS